MFFKRAAKPELILAALLACGAVPATASAGCLAVAGAYSGTFTAKATRSSDNLPAEINGTWTAEVDGVCGVKGSVTSGLSGTQKTMGKYGGYGPVTREFDAANLFMFVQGSTVWFGTEGPSKQRLAFVTVQDVRYAGEFKADKEIKKSLNSADETTAILYSKENDQKIELTVVSEELLNRVFKLLAAREDIPYAYLHGESWAIAHTVARILEDNQIIAGKAFVEGEIYLDAKPSIAAHLGEAGLKYYIAPVVMVRKGNAVVPYILDPSLFSEPVPQKTWKAKLLAKPKAKFTREYYTNRFATDIADKDAKLTGYSDEGLEEMRGLNRRFSRELWRINKM